MLILFQSRYRDRSIGLEKRKDLTGRLIRLLNSTYLSGSGEAAGKFLFAICDQDRKLCSHSLHRFLPTVF